MEKETSATASRSDLADMRKWLDGRLDEITTHNKSQEASLVQINNKLDVLEGETFTANETCDQLRAQNTSLREEVNDLREQVNFLDAYQRRDNLRFYNIPEVANENTEHTLKTFISEKLQLNTKYIDFSIVHRLGAKNNRGGARCIIARFVRRSDVQKVKAGAVKLGGTRYGISEDLPHEWAVARSKAHKQHVKPAKEKKQKIRWKGATLFVDGREVKLSNERANSPEVVDSGRERRDPRPTNVSPARADNDETSSAQSTPLSPRPRRDRRRRSSSPRGADRANRSASDTDSNVTLTQSLLDRLNDFRHKSQNNTAPNIDDPEPG